MVAPLEEPGLVEGEQPDLLALGCKINWGFKRRENVGNVFLSPTDSVLPAVRPRAPYVAVAVAVGRGELDGAAGPLLGFDGSLFFNPPHS